MIPLRLARPTRALTRTLVRPSFRRDASSLVYIEHRDGKMNNSTLHAVSAAKKADSAGEGVEAIVVGGSAEVDKVVEEAKQIDGIGKVYVAKGSSEDMQHQMAEVVAPTLKTFLESHPEIKHLFAAHTAVGKNLFPRLSGLLDVSMVADIVDVQYSAGEDVTEFSRPIYAGNAIVRVKTDGKKDKVRVVTCRTTAFDKAAAEGGSAAVEEVQVAEAEAPAKFVSEQMTQSSRPDLSSAPRVVSGGRALKSAENFDSVLEPLADSFGAGERGAMTGIGIQR